MGGFAKQELQVLIADDDAAFRELVSEFLSGKGHEVDQTDNGVDAWARITSERYDCVILDVRMPGMNGLEVLRLMRKLSYHPRSILVSTEQPTYGERVAITLGADACYDKPISLDRLLTDIAKDPLPHRDNADISMEAELRG